MVKDVSTFAMVASYEDMGEGELVQECVQSEHVVKLMTQESLCPQHGEVL